MPYQWEAWPPDEYDQGYPSSRCVKISYERSLMRWKRLGIVADRDSDDELDDRSSGRKGTTGGHPASYGALTRTSLIATVAPVLIEVVCPR